MADIKIANTVQTPNRPCTCNGSCTGYASQSDCPPLIVLAVAAIGEIPRLHAAPL
jgi:predicted metal-binding protein